MTGDLLKKTLLQWAVQGNLVPQDPSDEPALCLVQRIDAEKKRLVKEGKIKKEKHTSTLFKRGEEWIERIDGRDHTITKDIPFAIPASWTWVRLGNIVYNHGQTKPSAKFCYIDIGSIDNQRQQLSATETIVEPQNASPRARRIVWQGDILYATVRPYLHNACIADRNFSCQPIASTGFAVMACYPFIQNKYLLNYLLSPSFDAYANATDNAVGVAYPAISDKKLYQALIPLPPLAEQERIVAKLEALEPLVARFGEVSAQLTKLDAGFKDAFRKSVLQWAVQGKLVPQNPEDEPVEALLKRIEEEKKRLVKEGKLKKEKPLPPITEEEIPFEIPASWTWVRLGNVGDWGAGATPSRSRSEYFNGNIPWLKTGDLTDGEITQVPESISDAALTATSVRLNPVGSVLIAMYGATIGKLGILTFPATTNQACCACIPFTGVFNRYIFYYLFSQRTAFIKRGAGGAQPNISKEKIVSTLFPLPPLAEQKRIVAKLEEVLGQLEK